MSDTNIIKKETFFRLLDLVGRVFLLVRYSDNVHIGKRGFIGHEKENGIILVITNKMKFTWDEVGIDIVMAFGTTPEKCHIPLDDIIGVYSPELKLQLMVSPDESVSMPEEQVESAAMQDEVVRKPAGDNIIRVDFSKRG